MSQICATTPPGPAAGAKVRELASVEFPRKMMGLLGNLKDAASQNQVAANLNQINVPTMHGGRWTAKALSQSGNDGLIR